MINFSRAAYTEAEIITMYKQAKNRPLQIKIIADLLLTTQREVKEFLTEKGLLKAAACTKKKRRLNKSKIWTPARVERLIEGYQNGEDKKQLANELGITMYALYQKAYKLGLTNKRLDSQNSIAV